MYYVRTVEYVDSVGCIGIDTEGPTERIAPMWRDDLVKADSLARQALTLPPVVPHLTHICSSRTVLARCGWRGIMRHPPGRDMRMSITLPTASWWTAGRTGRRGM